MSPRRTTRRRSRTVAALVVAAALLTAACGGSSAGGGAGADGPTRAFAADNGPVDIPVEPRRVAALGATVVSSLEAGQKPVAVSTLGWASGDFRQWYSPDELARYDAAIKVGQAADVDYEALASARPDVIVVSVPRNSWPRFDAQRLGSIAPTVFVATDIARWKQTGERLADAIGAPRSFAEQRAAYDRKAEEIRGRFGDVLRATTVASVNRWATTTAGSFVRESANGYCTAHAADAGVQVQYTGRPGTNGETVSLELLGGLAQYGALLYPLNADDSLKRDFVPVTGSSAWRSLPQVTSGRTLGVRCSELLTYQRGLDYLQSLEDALGRMPTAG